MLPVDGNDLTRLLLDAHRALSTDLDAALSDRATPTSGPGTRSCSSPWTGGAGAGSPICPHVPGSPSKP